MLRRIAIENIALIERLQVDLAPGLTIITGETGAGKSILIDALGLVLGERAESHLLRAGADQGMVSAVFAPPPEHPAWAWLAEQALGDDTEEELFLRRVITRSGRSRAFINDTPAPVASLAKLGALMVDIHGQHDHQSLLNPRVHRDILDAFAAHHDLLQETNRRFARWEALKKELDHVRSRGREAGERRAFLQFQLDELEAAAVAPGELAALGEQKQRLGHVARLTETAMAAMGNLNDHSPSAIEMLGRTASDLEGAADMDPGLSRFAETLRSCQYEIEAVADGLRHYADGLESDPGQLDQVEERLDLIHGLCRKHRQEADELESLAELWRAEVEELDRIEDRDGELAAALAREAAGYQESAEALARSRQEAANRLNRAVESHLKELHMTRTRLNVSVRTQAGEPRRGGMEEVEILVSANVGAPLQPLKQVASGGELSRIMLAMKTVLADVVTVSTLIFDEVDVGVGGRVAARIGAKLAQVAASGRQVLAITHLPQVAAWGDGHMKVEKRAGKGRTQVGVTALAPAERTEELARMLAGDEVSPAARRNAQELLKASRL